MFFVEITPSMSCGDERIFMKSKWITRPLHALVVRLTFGRPMKYQRQLFRDVVGGNMVNEYIDYKGRVFMANHPWSWFRVPK